MPSPRPHPSETPSRRRRTRRCSTASIGRTPASTRRPCGSSPTTPTRSRRLAEETLAITRAETPSSTGDAYWHAVTEAEAYLLLGDAEATRAALERAEREAPGDYAARASTRKQLRLICDHAEIPRSRARSAAHAAGDPLLRTPGCRRRAATGRFPAAPIRSVRAEVDAYLIERDVGFGYGSLASGADIIVAEALLARGAELHVTLPIRTGRVRRGVGRRRRDPIGLRASRPASPPRAA